VAFVGFGVVRTHVAAGTLKALAVSQPARLQAAPGIPGAVVAGLPAIERKTRFGIVAPRGTPERIVAAVARQIHAMQEDPVVLKRYAENGLEPLRESPAQFGARMRRDHEKFRAIVKAAGLKPE
jgi:tripartite-type tricarboxylate transporter receptor subunit TctC